MLASCDVDIAKKLARLSLQEIQEVMETAAWECEDLAEHSPTNAFTELRRRHNLPVMDKILLKQKANLFRLLVPFIIVEKSKQ